MYAIIEGEFSWEALDTLTAGDWHASRYDALCAARADVVGTLPFTINGRLYCQEVELADGARGYLVELFDGDAA